MVRFLRLSLLNRRGLLSLAAIFWLTSFGLLTSCTKEQAAPTGSIEGTILPAGGVTTVTATAPDGQAYQAVPDPTTGQVRFATLPAGAYTLTFTTILPYKTPLPVAVQLAAGTTTRPTFPELTRDGKIRGTLRWTIGNTTYTSTQLLGQVTSSIVSFSGVATTLGASHELIISLPAEFRGQTLFQGVGTYRMGQEYPFGSYTLVPAGSTMYDPFTYGTTYPRAGGGGTITVTRFDPKAFVVAGTFEFLAEAQSSAATGTARKGSLISPSNSSGQRLSLSKKGK
jgi:hypothetical protein